MKSFFPNSYYIDFINKAYPYLHNKCSNFDAGIRQFDDRKKAFSFFYYHDHWMLNADFMKYENIAIML